MLTRTVDVRAEVYLADIIVLQDSGVSCVGGVMGRTMVQRTARREGQACIQSAFLDQLARTVLQPLTLQGYTEEYDEMKCNENTVSV